MSEGPITRLEGGAWRLNEPRRLVYRAWSRSRKKKGNDPAPHYHERFGIEGYAQAVADAEAMANGNNDPVVRRTIHPKGKNKANGTPLTVKMPGSVLGGFAPSDTSLSPELFEIRSGISRFGEETLRGKLRSESYIELGSARYFLTDLKGRDITGVHHPTFEGARDEAERELADKRGGTCYRVAFQQKRVTQQTCNALKRVSPGKGAGRGAVFAVDMERDGDVVLGPKMRAVKGMRRESWVGHLKGLTPAQLEHPPRRTIVARITKVGGKIVVRSGDKPRWNRSAPADNADWEDIPL